MLGGPTNTPVQTAEPQGENPAWIGAVRHKTPIGPQAPTGRVRVEQNGLTRPPTMK